MNAGATSNRMTTWCLPVLLSLLAMVLIDYHDGMCAEWKVVTKRYEPSEVLYAIQDEGLEKHTRFYFPEYRMDDKALYSGYRPIEQGEDVEKRSEAADFRHVWKTRFSKPIVPGETVFFYSRIYVENVDRYSISLHLSKSDVWIEKMVNIPFTGYQLPLNSPLSSWRGKIDNVETSQDTREADTVDKMLIKVYPKGDQYDFVIGDLKIYKMEWVDKNYTHPLFRPILTNYTEGALDFDYKPPGVPLASSSVAWRSLVGHNGDPYYIEPAASSTATSYSPVDLRELKTTMFRQFMDKYPFYKERGLEKSDLLARFNSFATVPISHREAFNDSLIALVSTYSDPHFNASKIGARRSSGRRSTPPVVFYEILGEVRVAAVFATELKDEIKPGMRLFSVQDQPIQDVISELSERFRGSAYSRRQKAISSILRYLPDSSEIAIGLASEDENGEMVEVRLNTGGDYRIPPNFVPRHGEFRVLDGDIAYFRISRWSLDVWTRFSNHMSDFKKANGLIIDLRSNPGGEATSVIRIISLFIDEPTLYSREYTPANGRTEDLIIRPKEQYHIDLPVAILGNGQTTCASEDFIDTMQYAKKAAFVANHKTAGSVSAMIRVVFPDGLMVGVNSWSNRLSPAGRHIEGRGITPDIRVDINTVDDLAHHKDKMLNVAKSFLQQNTDTY
ncbi:MAG: S41 family peptidase [Gemmatimonadetes bacterium]|nr:S41 family peptidase [Gemmatimonadota bacterium]